MSIRRGRRAKRRYQFEGMTRSLEPRTLLTYTPIGEVFQVNETVGVYAANPLAATSPDGETTVVWRDRQENGDGLMGRRIDALGQPLDSEFVIREAADDVWSDLLSVGLDDQSNLWVVWQESNNGGSSLLLQRYDAEGAAIGDAQVLSEGLSSLAHIQLLPGGGLVALTTGEFQNTDYQLYFFDANGTLDASTNLGDPTNEDWTYNYTASLAGAGEGVVISWGEQREEEVVEPEETLYYGRTWARLFNLEGEQIGEDILIRSVDAATNEAVVENTYVDLQSLTGGGFLAHWVDTTANPENPNGQHWAQLYSGDGVAEGDPFLISPENSNPAWNHIAQLSDGNFVSLSIDVVEGDAAFQFQILSSTGEPVTEWAPIDTEGHNLGYPHQLSATTDAGFLILWHVVTDPPADGDGIYALMYAEDGENGGGGGDLETIVPDLYVDKGEEGLWVWSESDGEVLLSSLETDGVAVAEDGRAYLDFGQEGLWTWATGEAEPVLFNGADPDQLIVGPDGAVYIDYGQFGLWRADAGVFTQLNGADADGFVVTEEGVLFVDFGQFGLWRRGVEGDFALLNGADADDLAVTPNGVLFVDFGQFGLWRQDAEGIVKINDADADSLTGSSDDSLFVDFGQFGVWRWLNDFQQISEDDPNSLLSDVDGTMFLNLGADGFWSWTEDDGLTLVNEGEAQSEVIGRDGLLYLVFGPDDVQRRDTSGEFTELDITGVQKLFA